jgi:hypothetical protein
MWHLIDSALKRIGNGREQRFSGAALEVSASVEYMAAKERLPYVGLDVLSNSGNLNSIRTLALIYSELRALRKEVKELRRVIDLRE